MVAWYLVWAELLFLSTLITVLILPLPLLVRSLLTKGINFLWHSFYFRAFFWANLCVVLFQFGDSYNQMLKYQANKSVLAAGMTAGAGSLGEKLDINMKLFRAQRNVYLSFFCLFEVLVTYGLVKYIRELQAERLGKTKEDKKEDKEVKKSLKKEARELESKAEDLRRTAGTIDLKDSKSPTGVNTESLAKSPAAVKAEVLVKSPAAAKADVLLAKSPLSGKVDVLAKSPVSGNVGSAPLELRTK